MKFHLEVLDPPNDQWDAKCRNRSVYIYVSWTIQRDVTEREGGWEHEHNRDTSQHTADTFFTVLPKEGLKISNIKRVFVLNSELTSDLWMCKSDQALEN